MTKLEPISLDLQINTSRPRAATGAFRKAAWRLMRQRRTLRWRRLADGTVQVQQRLMPWSAPIVFPGMRKVVQAAADAEREAKRVRPAFQNANDAPDP